MDEKQISGDCWLLFLSIIIFFSALESLIFLWFQFLSKLTAQSPAQQSHCQDQKSFLEFHKGLILPIQSCHSLPKTLKGKQEDHCCPFQTPKKVKTCHLFKTAEAASLALMLFHHQRVSHKWNIPVSTGYIVVPHKVLMPDGKGAWAELMCLC